MVNKFPLSENEFLLFQWKNNTDFSYNFVLRIGCSHLKYMWFKQIYTS